jgi:alkylation response protein AidB-like acyl-CoA dehydrogenase
LRKVQEATAPTEQAEGRVDFKDTPEEAAWRQEVREFLRRELPARNRAEADGEAGWLGRGARPLRPEDVRPRSGAEAQPRSGGMGGFGMLREWRRKLQERGWIAPAWPKEYGGAGLSVKQQFILNEEFAEARAPAVGGMGITMVGPTLMAHGTEEQKREYLPRIISGELNFCQGFSEPGAGSDLASLQTRAVLDGDDFIVNGQKIWTSGAQFANWMFMLVRTDPDAPKHRGITYLLLPMSTPGITVQPLVTMAGTAAFNQVFFDNVRVPRKNVVGEVNRGWYVGATTLDFERSGIGNSVGQRHAVEELVRFAREGGEKSMLRRNPALRVELADRLIEAHVAKMLSYRVVSMQDRGLIPNYEASIAKLYNTELTQRVARTGMKVVGLYGNVFDGSSKWAALRARYAQSYLGSVAVTIYGGTSEIQRNIVATRGLGLPRE